ncbi:hypothetical protein ACJIZ3_016803 [Penstemon smallii]|uniref:Uncharacterized protein n=1 Tax=Penstemon smallii TaxID=265156 RepID=A0ABD3SUB2_9LAMI
MPNPVKIQPIDFNALPEGLHKFEPVAKPVLLKSRFKRLFERQFSNVLKSSVPEKLTGVTDKDGSEEFEPSSICLGRMVQNFIEESSDKPQQRCGRNRCNCFNGNCTDSSDEELDSFNFSSTDACDVLKSLVVCLCVSERNLLADTAKIVEKNKISKRKDGNCRKIVVDGLITLGYNASICKTKWEKTSSYPAGEYEYVDVIIEGKRLIIDIEFRSEFEIARSTKAYKLVLQTLPSIFVGKFDRLEKIIEIVSEAGKQSLKKKGMPCPPWRKSDYIKAKWLSPFTRSGQISTNNYETGEKEDISITKKSSCCGDFDLLFGEEWSNVEKLGHGESNSNSKNITGKPDGVKFVTPLMKQWELPEIKPKSSLQGVKIMTGGLASVIKN